MHLYKYVAKPEYILEDGYIRATQLSALNDPFEANYSKKGLKELVREFEGPSNGEEFINYIEENKHKVGVISFTESKDDLLMWAHYADEHKGASIDFHFFDDTTPDIFMPDGSAMTNEHNYFNGTCLPVTYRKQPIYEIDKFDRDYCNVSAEGEDRILFEIFQQKSNEWIYEKEHRITLKLEQADRVIINNVRQYESEKWYKNIFIENILREEEFFRFEGNKLFVFLENISDDSNRFVYGNILSNLAKDNPNILYLFKIPASLWSIAYGVNVDEITIKDYSNECMITRFEKFKAVIDSENYTLKFEKIEK